MSRPSGWPPAVPAISTERPNRSPDAPGGRIAVHFAAMLRYRLIFGPLMIVGLLLILLFDDWLDRVELQDTFWQPLFLGRRHLPAGLLMLVFLLVAIALGTRELAAIIRAKYISADPFVLWLAGTLGCVLMYIIPYQMESQPTIAIYASVMVGLFLLSLQRYTRQKRTEGAVVAASVTMFAFIYMGVLPGFFLLIRRWESAWMIAAIILITKSSDIGAYFTGRAIGRHKLIPWLSPGKTWEGVVGGLISSALVAIGLAALSNAYDLAGVWDPQLGDRVTVYYPWWFAGLAGLLFGVVGVVGDLTASLFKRDAGIKDSGQSIPGFGGVLDVVDSPILVAPLAYWLLALGASLWSAAPVTGS